MLLNIKTDFDSQKSNFMQQNRLDKINSYTAKYYLLNTR